MFRPSEIGGFDIPYVHIRTYIFKKSNRYKNRIFPLICVENPVCFLVRYVCKNNPKLNKNGTIFLLSLYNGNLLQNIVFCVQSDRYNTEPT